MNLDNFPIPEVAREHFMKNGWTQRTIAADVSEIMPSGHDKGLPFIFFMHREKSEILSMGLDVDIPVEFQMIRYFKGKDKLDFMVKELPDQLLKFSLKDSGNVNCEGKKIYVKDLDRCLGGQYKEAYLAWRGGLKAPGTPLDRLPNITENQIYVLRSANIFTIEQFIEVRADQLGKYPTDLEIPKLQESASRFLNGMKPMESLNKAAEEMASLRQENARRAQEVEDLRDQVKALMSVHSAPKKKGGRPKKAEAVAA